MEYRTERDTMGPIEVPAHRYWGAQTERSRNNFKIGREASMPIEIVHAFAFLKKAAARTNAELGVLDAQKSAWIGSVCDEILEGKLDDEFPLVVWQTGSGTQSNMNVNEVIANRGHVIQGGVLTDEKKVLHPNDDVNKSQSSNDTFPTAMHIAAYRCVEEITLPGVELLRNILADKAKEFDHVVKTGRTHFMDATPLTVGQEFSGYVQQLENGIRALKNAQEMVAELALGGWFILMIESRIIEAVSLKFTVSAIPLGILVRATIFVESVIVMFPRFTVSMEFPAPPKVSRSWV